MMRFAKGCSVLAGLAAMLGGSGLYAQAPAPKKEFSPVPNRVLTTSITLDFANSGTTSANSFWLKGASAEVNDTLTHGLGLKGSITGLNTANTGGGVPLKLGLLTFGPSYTLQTHLGKHPANVFFHGLVGAVKGYNGIFPATGGAKTGANSLATKVGGGLDVMVQPHLSIRLIEANWVRTQLPNATSNVQNDTMLSAGFVIRLGKK